MRVLSTRGRPAAAVLVLVVLVALARSPAPVAAQTLAAGPPVPDVYTALSAGVALIALSVMLAYLVERVRRL